MLDVGKPLDAGKDDQVPLPSAVDADVAAVLISHAHQDHWGLVDQVPATVPIYIGEDASRILNEAAFWTTGWSVEPAGFLKHRQPFDVGPFRVTPYLNDHSAFDAYSMLIEAAGRRLFYTGDIRGHGRKKDIFAELLRKPPSDVDVLLMEGTNIRPGMEPAEATLTETDLEMACAAVLKKTPGLVLASYSAQNVDRMVTLYNAVKRAGRSLVMDLYGASIARVTGHESIPRPREDWPLVRVFVPQWQRVKVKQAEAFERVEAIKAFRIYEKELAASPGSWVIASNLQTATFLHKKGCLEGASAIWSMWPGYMKDGSGKRYVDWLASRGIPFSVEHTSGHASIEDLQRLADALAPTRIVPIHSLGAEQFENLFTDVEVHVDGEWWKV